MVVMVLMSWPLLVREQSGAGYPSIWQGVCVCVCVCVRLHGTFSKLYYVQLIASRGQQINPSISLISVCVCACACACACVCACVCVCACACACACVCVCVCACVCMCVGERETENDGMNYTDR